MPDIARTILVTGASSGIGRAIARKLLDQGHTVIGASRDCKQFNKVLPHFYPFEMNLSQLPSLPQAAQHLLKTYPAIDAAVFCAGMGQFGSLEEFSYAQIEALMTLNFTSQAFLTRALLPHFKRQSKSDIIFIGSEAGLRGTQKGSIYCASKFAIRGFTQALREECSKSHLRVALINPGMVKTPFFDALSFQPGSADGQFIRPEDVADAVLYVLASNTAIVIDEINLSPLNKVISFKKETKI